MCKFSYVDLCTKGGKIHSMMPMVRCMAVKGIIKLDIDILGSMQFGSGLYVYLFIWYCISIIIEFLHKTCHEKMSTY